MSRRFRTGFAAILVALTAFFALPAAEAQQAAQNPRLALVIGNATYRDAALATPANDAGLVAQTLQAAGFDVVGARDLDGQSLRTAFRDFLQKAAAAGPDMQAFVYLAGRAVQYNGDNYFVPVDARINRDADVPIEAIRMSDFTHALAATPGRARIIVLDAARANPYAAQGAPLAPGLALVDPEPGELIAFNAAPGTLAGDEEGPYGVYAKTLAGAIRQGGVDIAQAFDQTRVSVNAETQGALLPFSASRLGGPFYVFERAADAPPPGPSLAETERQPLSSLSAADAYGAALERDTMKGYREFLAAYPKSDQARRVRAILAVRREAAYWRRTVGADTPRAYWTYLHTYPKGPHVADARRRLAMLSAEFEPPPDFRPERFADLPPPPPDERFYEERPIYAFDDFGPPPPPPAEQYVYVEDDDWRDLPPPPPPPQIGVLPVLGFALPIAVGAVAYQGLFHRNGIAPQGAPRFRPPPPAPPPLPANIKPQAPPQPAAAASAAANGAVVKPLPPIGRRGRPGAPAAAPGNPAVAVPPAALPAGKTNPPPGAAAPPAVRVAPGGKPLPPTPVASATGGKPLPASTAPVAPARAASLRRQRRLPPLRRRPPLRTPRLRRRSRFRPRRRRAIRPWPFRQPRFRPERRTRRRAPRRCRLFASLRAASPYRRQRRRSLRRRAASLCPRRLSRQRPRALQRRSLTLCRNRLPQPLRLLVRRSRRSMRPRRPPRRLVRFPRLYTRPRQPLRRQSLLVPRLRRSTRPLRRLRRQSHLVPRSRRSTRRLRLPRRLRLLVRRSRQSTRPRRPLRRQSLLVPRLRQSTRPLQLPRRPPLRVRFPRQSTRPRRRNCGPAESPACRPVRNRRAASAGHDKPALNGLADQGADPRRHRHRQRAPEADPERRPQHGRAARPGAERAERDQKDQRGGGDGLNDGALRREKRRQRRQRGADREGESRREGGLGRPWAARARSSQARRAHGRRARPWP